jgi:hypothetical protein
MLPIASPSAIVGAFVVRFPLTIHFVSLDCPVPQFLFPLFAAIESEFSVHSLGILGGRLVLVQDQGVRLDVIPVEL